jgi:hypothetical protein
MATMKYIRYENLGVVIFENHNRHKDMNERIQSEMADKVISAGTVAAWAVGDDLEVQASEGSLSLEVGSRDDDADLIKRRLKLY